MLVEIFLTQESVSLPVVIELLVDVGTDVGILLLHLLVGDRILAALVGIA